MDKEVVSLHVAVGLDWMTFKSPSQPKGFCDSPNSDSLSLDISIGWCEYSLNVHPNDPLAIGTTFLFLFMHLVSLGAFSVFQQNLRFPDLRDWLSELGKGIQYSLHSLS